MAPKNPGSRRRLANNLSHEQDLITRMFRGSMLWQPDRIAKSAWLDHVPFAFWLVDVLRPKRIVELGTHFGVSYSAMCQAVNQLGLAASCFAIDTWKGDEQAGFYDESVFGEFSEFHDRRYGGFSRLVRSTFDEALGHFGNETIDLLHIDGQHTYEAVRHDYESWRPKLSTNSVVLFHDTNVREEDFGVDRFWSELTQGHVHFNFLHGHGLGVLGIGSKFPSELKLLFRANEEDHLCASVRECFRLLGRSVHLLFDVSKLQETTAVHGSEVVALRSRLLAHDNQVASLNQTIAERDEKIISLTHELAVRASEVDGLRHQLTSNDKELTDLRNKIAEGDSKGFMLEKELTARMSEADGLRQRLLANDKQLTNLKDTIADRDSKVLVLKKEAAARAREVDASDKRLADRAREITSLKDGIANRDRQIADFRYGLAEKNARIDYLDSVVRALYSSTSWQVTAPLRALRRGFTKAPEGVSLSSQAKTLPILASNREKSSSGLRLVCISSEWYSPGHIYRVVHLTDAARLIGLDAYWMKLEEVPERLGELSNAYAVIFWRTAWNERVEIAVAAARQGGARVIFDVDDLMIDPALARTSIIDGIRTQGLTEEHVRAHYALVRRSMLEADICTTTTDEIASYMRVVGKPTFVLPNGFDNATLKSSRLAVRRRRKMIDDGVTRIGYASGSRTHQRDFAVVANALARVLRERPQCRLVLFREKGQGAPFVDISEYGILAEFSEQVEWRDFVALENLPEEMARFDLNLAPLEPGNPFCESKSELKYFEAALVDVITIASPTGPFRRAIRNGETGFLAGDETAWYNTLIKLVDDPTLRRKLGRAARFDAIRRFGTIRRTKSLADFVAQLVGGREAAYAFELEAKRISSSVAQLPQVPEAEVIFESDNCRSSEVTIVVPVFNYAHHIVDALDSVQKQTLSELDLVVVDDCSTDDSVRVALEWVKHNVGRFNRLLLLRNRRNAGVGRCRNVAFDAAETPYVLPLDPDNRLLPLCCERLLAELKDTDVAFAYPIIQQFEDGSALMGALPFEPQRFVSGNYIDAMALISKEAWVCVGGYVNMWGWEDYDFWCGFIEQGLRGKCVNEVLAEYRVHASSMLRTMTESPENKRILLETISRRHVWLSLVGSALVDSRHKQVEQVIVREKDGATSRLEYLLPYLRCPETGAPLVLGDDGFLYTPSSGRRWRVVNGRPILYPGMAEPEIKPDSHISNALPKIALDIIRQARGLVLNLSAGGTTERYDHVIEAEAAIFLHTDAVVDAHHLPFADETYEAVIALNAFEHYRDPRRVANEILRILRPGGRVLIHTAFLQPLHEPPWHYYNCTRYGLEAWFDGFECERIHVSENFAPSYSISWLASECEAALRRDVSAAAAEAFVTAPVGLFSRFWREPESRTDRRWTDFTRLSQNSQETIAAGFEFIGRKPSVKSH